MIAAFSEKIDRKAIESLFNTQKQHVAVLRKEPVIKRKERLRKLRNWIKANRQTIQEALYSDFQKPAVEVDATEIFPVLSEVTHAISNLDTWTKPKKIDAPLTMLGTRSILVYEPRGVCLIIAPWNYPFSLCLGPLISALAAGNSAIIKPSEVTPYTSALVKKMCDEIFDPRVVNVCEGDVEVSQQLLDLPFDHIFFTGSPLVGKIIMKAAANHLSSITLELGGKSPAIVTPSANLKTAAQRIALTKFINNGQTCIAPDYVLVHESKADEFLKRLKEQINVMFSEKGKSICESPFYARIVNNKHFQRLSELLNDAVERGANVYSGESSDSASRFIPPVILSNVPPDARVMEEEIFGPVLPVLTYASFDEVIDVINAKHKPLALYLFGSDSREQQRVRLETSSGSICINDCAIQFLNHNLPFGGVNNSGIGKSHGYSGFLSFSNEKPILKQRRGYTTFQPFYPPYTKWVKKLMNALLKLI